MKYVLIKKVTSMSPKIKVITINRTQPKLLIQRISIKYRETESEIDIYSVIIYKTRDFQKELMDIDSNTRTVHIRKWIRREMLKSVNGLTLLALAS
jgi:hypothetical protein